MFSPKDS